MRVVILLLLVLTILPAVLGAFNEETICGRAVGRCEDEPQCDNALNRVKSRCQGSDLNCKRCGLAIARMARNQDGLSVLLCVNHTGRERKRIENFLQQCTNTDRTPPPIRPTTATPTTATPTTATPTTATPTTATPPTPTSNTSGSGAVP